MLLETTNVVLSAASEAMACSDVSTSGYSWVWMTVVPIGFYYSAISVYSNAVECYNFVAAWNMISRANRMDLEIMNIRKSAAIKRRKATEEALCTRPYRDVFFPKEATCPVCLLEFERSDAVSSCSDSNADKSKVPCCHIFHKECITLWLQNHSNCPCCRHEILPLPEVPSPHPMLVATATAT